MTREGCDVLNPVGNKRVRLVRAVNFVGTTPPEQEEMEIQSPTYQPIDRHRGDEGECKNGAIMLRGGFEGGSKFNEYDLDR